MALTRYVLNPIKSTALNAYAQRGKVISGTVQAGIRVAPYGSRIGLAITTLASMAVIGYHLSRPVTAYADGPKPTPTPTGQPIQPGLPIFIDIDAVVTEIVKEAEKRGPDSNVTKSIEGKLAGEGSTAIYEGLHDTSHRILDQRRQKAREIADQRASATAIALQEAECWKGILGATERTQKSVQDLDNTYKKSSQSIRRLPDSDISPEERARALAEIDANYAEEKRNLNLKAVVLPGAVCLEAKESQKFSVDNVRKTLYALIDEKIEAAHKGLDERLGIPAEMREKSLSPEYVPTPTPPAIKPTPTPKPAAIEPTPTPKSQVTDAKTEVGEEAAGRFNIWYGVGLGALGVSALAGGLAYLYRGKLGRLYRSARLGGAPTLPGV